MFLLPTFAAKLVEEPHVSRGGLRQGSGTEVPRVQERGLSTSSPTKSASETPRGEHPTQKPLAKRFVP